LGEKMDSFACREIGGGSSAGNVGTRVQASDRTAKKIDGGFGEDHFHDGFAVTGAGDAASFGVGIAAAADERRIADAAGKFAASSAVEVAAKRHPLASRAAAPTVPCSWPR